MPLVILDYQQNDGDEILKTTGRRAIDLLPFVAIQAAPQDLHCLDSMRSQYSLVKSDPAMERSPGLPALPALPSVRPTAPRE